MQHAFASDSAGSTVLWLWPPGSSNYDPDLLRKPFRFALTSDTLPAVGTARPDPRV
jgi:hypothetical protein